MAALNSKRYPRVLRFGLAAAVVTAGYLALYAGGCSRKTTRKTIEVEELAQKIGMGLPPDSKLIAEGDSGREGEFYYEWLIYSPSRIEMPKMQLKLGRTHLNMPLASSVDLIESRMSGRKCAKPKLALASDWKTEEANYQGTLVRTERGDYLLVMRFEPD